MSNELFLTSLTFGLFVVCPRMAGMMHIIASHSPVSMLWTVIVGTFFSVPLLIAMVLVFTNFGIWGALVFCIFTDLGAAFVIKDISITAGVETLVVALFVVLGVKLAPLISGVFIK